MKLTFLMRTLSCCVAGSLLTSTAIARQASGDSSAGATGNYGTSTVGQGQPPAPSETLSSSGSYGGMRNERLSQVMGATVKDQQGNTIGQINDFVINPMSGRIQFAVISLNDQSGKLTAVPWQLVRPGADPTTCTLVASKSKLENAQTFDASSWPDFSQQSTTQQIYSHYGVQPQGHTDFRNEGGTGGSYNSGTGEYNNQGGRYNNGNNPGGSYNNNPNNSGGQNSGGTGYNNGTSSGSGQFGNGNPQYNPNPKGNQQQNP